MRHMVVPPAGGEAEREDSAVIAEISVHVGRAFPRDHRLQRRRLKARYQPLRHRVVGDAERADAAVAPGLSSRPFDRVIEVARLRRRPGIGAPGRPARAAAVDAHASVAARHPPERVHRLPVHVLVRLFLQVRRRDPELVLLVAAEVDDDGETSGRFGTEDVGLQPRSVAHRDFEVLFDDEVEPELRCAIACFCLFRQGPRKSCYSILILASRRNSPHARVSCSTSCWNCAGEAESVTSSICLDRRSFISGSDRTAATARYILSMIGFGVAAGANIPCHALVPIPGNPCSAIVGTFGSSASRPGAVVASAFILPERTCGKAEDKLRNATGASPEMIAGIICPAPPLYGT